MSFLILTLFGIFEAYLRATIPKSSGESIFTYTMDTKRYKLMKKDATIIAWGEELHTDELGFRDDKTIVPEKRSDEFRVIVLGDSFTVSAGVSFDSIYTTLLEKKLQKQFKNVEVINLAVAGYNIVQYELVLNEIALDLEPDLILVSVFPTNDFSMTTYDKNYHVAKGDAVKQEDISWFKKSYVYRAFLWRVESKVKGLFAKPVKNESQIADAKKESERGWTENLAALSRILDTAEQNNIPAVVTLLPDSWGYEAQHKSIDRIKAYLADRNVEPIVLLYPFIESGIKEPELRVNLLDSHPNKQYHILVSEALMPHLTKIISESK
ncbi:MAG: SGNH/GDSL hydrolase family protein [Gammaproteobacteria bacterium]